MSPSESLKKGNTVLTDHSHCYRILGQEWQNTVKKISYPSPGSHPWPGSGAACSWGSCNDGPTPTCSGGISASVPADRLPGACLVPGSVELHGLCP